MQNAATRPDAGLSNHEPAEPITEPGAAAVAVGVDDAADHKDVNQFHFCLPANCGLRRVEVFCVDRSPDNRDDPLRPINLPGIDIERMPLDRRFLGRGQNGEFDAKPFDGGELPGEFRVQEQLIGRIFDLVVRPTGAGRFPVSDDK